MIAGQRKGWWNRRKATSGEERREERVRRLETGMAMEWIFVQLQGGQGGGVAASAMAMGGMADDRMEGRPEAMGFEVRGP